MCIPSLPSLVRRYYISKCPKVAFGSFYLPLISQIVVSSLASARVTHQYMASSRPNVEPTFSNLRHCIAVAEFVATLTSYSRDYINKSYNFIVKQ